MRFRTDPRLSRPVQPFCAPSRCRREELNLYAVRRYFLGVVCLPDSTTAARQKGLDSDQHQRSQGPLSYR